jgi:hypothetical protein
MVYREKPPGINEIGTSHPAAVRPRHTLVPTTRLNEDAGPSRESLQ